VAKFYEIEQGIFLFNCPGCGYDHHVHSENFQGPTPKWSFNGDIEKPTVSPSLLVFASKPERRCHSFIKDGQIQFLSDCFHKLAGKTVDIPEYEW